MNMSIQNNLLAMNANRMFNITEGKKGKSTEKLSSGYRINRAADDAAGLAISEKMRRQIRGLNQTVRNINEGIALCNVADGALNEISDMLNREEELLVQAANDTNTETDRSYIEQELKQLANEMNRTFGTATYNERLFFKGKDVILDDPAPTHTVTPYDNIVTDPVVTTVIDTIITSVTEPEDTVENRHKVEAGTRRTILDEGQELYDVDEKGHDIYKNYSTFTVEYGPEVTTDTKVTTTYEKLPPDPLAIQLTSPGAMTGARGYINVKNGLGWQLSCAMSQLGVKIGDNVKSLDLYGTNSISVTSDISADGKVAKHTYDIGDGLFLTQKIELSGDDKYKISYSMENRGTEDKTASVRLAFDTMNTYDNTDNHSAIGQSSYMLKSNIGEIKVSADADETVLGNIDQLYNTWGHQKVLEGKVVGHSGFGAWWNDRSISAGASVQLGAVEYGPIKVADQYKRTVTTETQVTREWTGTVEEDVHYLSPEYIDIQTGVEAGQQLPIRLWDLDTEKLRCRVPNEVSAYQAQDSFQFIKRAASQIAEIRSYYGASTNRLEHAARNNSNAAENTAAAESLIRDTDMAAEMVEYSNANVLLQAGQSMLAQANQSRQGILSLLQ